MHEPRLCRSCCGGRLLATPLMLAKLQDAFGDVLRAEPKILHRFPGLAGEPEALVGADQARKRRSERVTSPPFYLVDNLPPPVVDYLPLWLSNYQKTESNLFMARSTC
jgi:hypothetical protein